MKKLTPLIFALIILTGCKQAAVKVATKIGTAANNSQLSALDQQLDNAIAEAIKKPISEDTVVSFPELPTQAGIHQRTTEDLEKYNNELSQATEQRLEIIKQYDITKDGKLTWQDFDANLDGLLEAHEGLVATRVISEIWAKKAIDSVKERIANGENPKDVAIDEFGKWWLKVKDNWYTLGILALVAILMRKLQGPKQEEKVVQKVVQKLSGSDDPRGFKKGA